MFNKEYWEGILIPWWQILLLIVLSVTLIITIIAVISAVLKRRGEKSRVSTKDITYGAICVAASFALSYIRIFKLPYGGSITLASVLPMLIYCYYFGFRKSLVVSAVFMLLQLIQEPYIVSPWSALLDYFVPYLSLSLAGLFCFKRKKYDEKITAGKPPITCHLGFFIGTVIYFAVRYFSHTLAGVLFWAQDIDFLIWSGNLAGAAAWGYSATYNIIFLLPDTLIAVAAGAAILSSKTFNAFMASSCHALKNADAAHKDNQ
ncbi:MAG: hypothetical protein HFK08_05805 [Clostridia bacterium]|nr:hypothetical protein [Clostridia bacterium]